MNDIWNGLLQIKTRHHPDEMLGDVEGAYVQVFCKAHSEIEFIETIKEYMDELDFDYVNKTKNCLVHQLPFTQIRIAK